MNSFAKHAVGLLLFLTLASPAAIGQQVKTKIERRKLDAFLSKHDHARGPGGALLVLQKGKVAYSKAFGFASIEQGVRNSTNTVFSLDYGECREFTALTLAMLAEEGTMSLDDSARKYIPELPEFAAQIKIRDLIHNSSGLFDYGQQFLLAGWMLRNPLSNEDFFRLLRRQRRAAFPSGTDFMYSNTDYALLGFVVKRATGKSLREQADRLLFAPLGMKFTHIDDRFGEAVDRRAYEYFEADGAKMMKRRDKFSPSGRNGLLTTVGDLAKWAMALDDPNSKLHQASLMLRIGAVFDPKRIGEFNFGHFLRQHRGLQIISHQGISNSPYLVRIPEKSVSVIFLGNGGLDAEKATSFTLDILFFGGPDQTHKPVTAEPQQLAVWGAVLQREPKGVSVTAAELQSIAGGYSRTKGSRGRDFICDAQDQTLVEVFGGEIEPMVPLGNGVFFHLNCFIVFESNKDTGSIRLRAFSKQGDLVEEMERIPSISWPKAAELGEMVGDYYNHELDVTWELVALDGKLAVKRERMGNVFLWPSSKDRFLLSVMADPEAYSYDVELRFDRDAYGKVQGFSILSARLKGGLSFQKVRLESV